MFPSPRGDKLCRLTLRIIVRGMEFPSPRGDKLCPHGPSRELGPCPKELDGLSCMHQLFPGREPHQLYFVVLERGMLCKSIRNRCSCRTVPATRRTPETLTVLNSSANGAKPFFRWRLRRLRCYWWFYKSFSAFVRCLRSKTRWCSKREAHLIFVY